MPRGSRVLVVRRTGQDVAWDAARDVWWDDLMPRQPETHAAEAFDAEQPLYIMYTIDPAFAVHADAAAAAAGVPTDIRGAEAWAKRAIQAARGARLARPAMVEGSVGLIRVAPGPAVPGAALHVCQRPYYCDGSDWQSRTVNSN